MVSWMSGLNRHPAKVLVQEIVAREFKSHTHRQTMPARLGSQRGLIDLLAPD
jgi:hypothetical protein